MSEFEHPCSKLVSTDRKLTLVLREIYAHQRFMDRKLSYYYGLTEDLGDNGSRDTYCLALEKAVEDCKESIQRIDKIVFGDDVEPIDKSFPDKG